MAYVGKFRGDRGEAEASSLLTGFLFEGKNDQQR
jgi:hypothetical protein